MLFQWSDAAIDYLAELVNDGRWSASEIAKKFNERFGSKLTRSAIIGKVHRIGLTMLPRASSGAVLPSKPKRVPSPPKPRVRTPPPRPAPAPRPAAQPKPVVPVEILPFVPPATTSAVRFMDRRSDQCPYMLGSGFRSLCCGLPIVRGSYCAAHAALCYQDRSALTKRATKDVVGLARRGSAKAGAEPETADLLDVLEASVADPSSVSMPAMEL